MKRKERKQNIYKFRLKALRRNNHKYSLKFHVVAKFTLDVSS